MNKSLTHDTLAYQVGVRPALQFRDMSATPLKQVVAAMNEFFALSNVYDWIGAGGLTDEKVEHPEVDALVFYMLNHAVSLIRQKRHPLEPLGEFLPILESFHREMAVRSARMFYYLLLICARESRHEQNGSKMEALYKEYGFKLKQFQHSFPDSHNTAVKYFTENCPDLPLGRFTEYLSKQFYCGSYGSSFGGEAWGKVTDTLNDFVHGRITAEMMMDTAFTLAHNTGPIFNKAMLFHCQDNAALQKILDVQRSGQIPQLVAQGAMPKYTANERVVALYTQCVQVLPEFAGHVDWVKVEALGAVGSYASEKAAQFKHFGKSSFSATAPATTLGELLKKKLKQQEQEAQEAAEEEYIEPVPEHMKVYVFPGQYIAKTHSPRAKIKFENLD